MGLPEPGRQQQLQERGGEGKGGVRSGHGEVLSGPGLLRNYEELCHA